MRMRTELEKKGLSDIPAFSRDFQTFGGLRSLVLDRNLSPWEQLYSGWEILNGVHWHCDPQGEAMLAAREPARDLP